MFVPRELGDLTYPLGCPCPMPTPWPQRWGQGERQTGRDAAPMAVSDVTYHVCSSSAPLPAPAHLGYPGRCYGSSHTRPGALGPEESSRERDRQGCGEGTANSSPCILGWSLLTYPGHIPSPARPCCHLGPASGPQHPPCTACSTGGDDTTQHHHPAQLSRRAGPQTT